MTLQTTGVFEVGDFVSLAPVPPLEELTEPVGGTRFPRLTGET